MKLNRISMLLILAVITVTTFVSCVSAQHETTYSMIPFDGMYLKYEITGTVCNAEITKNIEGEKHIKFTNIAGSDELEMCIKERLTSPSNVTGITENTFSIDPPTLLITDSDNKKEIGLLIPEIYHTSIREGDELKFISEKDNETASTVYAIVTGDAHLKIMDKNIYCWVVKTLDGTCVDYCDKSTGIVVKTDHSEHEDEVKLSITYELIDTNAELGRVMEVSPTSTSRYLPTSRYPPAISSIPTPMRITIQTPMRITVPTPMTITIPIRRFIMKQLEACVYGPDGNLKCVLICDDDINVVNLDGSGEKRLVTLVTNGQKPKWISEGSKIKIIFGRDDDIWVVNLDGSGEKRLITNGQKPEWSPEGRKIIFNRDDDIWVANSDGSGKKRLVTNGQKPEWSPEGRKILFVSNQTGYNELWIVDSNGGNKKQLVTNIYEFYTPRWSPDGNRIVFTSINIGNRDVWIVNVEDGSKEQLTNDTKNYGHPSWSYDGTKIIYAREHAREIFEIWSMNADGSNKHQLYHTPYINESTARQIFDRHDIDNTNTTWHIVNSEENISAGHGVDVATPTPDTTKTSAKAEVPTSTPGFEAIFAITGLLVMTHLLRRRG